LPPQTTYVNALFASIDGARVTYLFWIDQLNFSVSAFGGDFNSHIFNVDNSATVKTDLLTGINIRMNTENFKVRMGYVTGNFDMGIEGVIKIRKALELFNYQTTADDLEFNGDIDVYQISASYETLKYFAQTEASLIKGTSKLIANIESYNLTLGLFNKEVTYYASASKLRTTNTPIVNQVPYGFSPELNLLNNSVNQLINSRLQENVDIVSVGLRWDINSTLAFKAEIDMIKGKSGQTSTFSRIDEDNFNHYSTLYLLSIDWLF